jgi:hypothetical protein
MWLGMLEARLIITIALDENWERCGRCVDGCFNCNALSAQLHLWCSKLYSANWHL